jgi:ribose/xylose/arabinose/galactoside ABC-type transport system permease subunit
VLTTAGIILAFAIIGTIFLFVASRILRIALKLVFAMAVILVLVVGAGVGWWRGWFETTKQNRIPATTTNKRAAPANRSPR